MEEDGQGEDMKRNKGDAKLTAVLRVRVTVAMVAWLEGEAVREGRSVGAVVRGCVGEGMKRIPGVDDEAGEDA